MTSARDTIDTIGQFLATVEKQAEAHTEPGSIGGPTEHPSKNVDDRTQTATEGERSAENTADVKEEEGPASVDSTPEAKAAALLANVSRLAQPSRTKAACKCGQTPCVCDEKDKMANDGPASTPGSAADDQIQIGTNKQPTGEDPSVETESAKAGKNDPGTKHPARTDNDALNGGKYAFDTGTHWKKTASMAAELGNRLCAGIQLLNVNGQKTAAARPQAPAANGNSVLSPETARQAGWELAGLANGTLDKRAADQMVVGTVAGIIKDAADMADRTITFLDSYKMASGENDPGDPSQAGAADTPPDPAASAGQQGGMTAAGPPTQDGGADQGGSDQDTYTAEQVLQLLEALGIDPQQALAAEQGMGGAGAGGAPPAGGGAMPAGDAAAMGGPAGGGSAGQPGMEVAANDRRNGQNKMAAARTNRSQKAAADVIREIIDRSRASGKR